MGDTRKVCYNRKMLWVPAQASTTSLDRGPKFCGKIGGVEALYRRQKQIDGKDQTTTETTNSSKPPHPLSLSQKEAQEEMDAERGYLTDSNISSNAGEAEKPGCQ